MESNDPTVLTAAHSSTAAEEQHNFVNGMF